MSDRVLRVVLTCSVALQWLAAESTAQMFDFNESVETAERLARDGKWSSAFRALDGVLDQCPGADREQCAITLDFTRAWITERRATDADVLNREYLEEAAQRYAEILSIDPGHGPSLHNLALLRLRQGNKEEAISILNRAVSDDASNASRHLVLLGDIYAETDLSAAAAMYRSAIDADPTDRTPYARYASLGADLPAITIPEYLNEVATWPSTERGPTTRAYRTVLLRTDAPDLGFSRDQAFVRWVSDIAQSGQLHRDLVSSLDPSWGPVAELLVAMDDPSSRPGWWDETPVRAQAYAQAAVSLGLRELRKGKVERAELRWQSALKIAPYFDLYDAHGPLADEHPARLELLTELAALYFEFPELDPDNWKFNEIIDQLFGGKADAYRSGDLASIQRHHTVLGIIYDMNPDAEGTHARTAVYQLANAVKTSRQRQARGEPYEPLPRVKELLANACADPSSYTKPCSHDDGSSAVPSLYIQAAQAYLDADVLADAERILSTVRNDYDALQSFDVQALEATSHLLSTRRALEEIPSLDADGQSFHRMLEDIPVHGWDSSLHGDSEFLNRQRFRMYVDIHKMAASANADWQAADWASIEQFTPATGDFERLHYLESLDVQLPETILKQD